MLEKAQEKARSVTPRTTKDKGYRSSQDGSSPTKKRKVANSAIRRVSPVKPPNNYQHQPVQGEDRNLEYRQTAVKPQRGESDKENAVSKPIKKTDNRSSASSLGPVSPTKETPRYNIPKTAGPVKAPRTPPKNLPKSNNASNSKPGFTAPSFAPSPHKPKHPLLEPPPPQTQLKPIPRPLETSKSSLSDIPTLSPRQNRLCDVLAVIDWVSPHVQSCFLGPKREIRLVDDTTEKRVLLSVFIHPHHFMPQLGTVALFRNLRNHKWEGYSLNAYEKDCMGWRWFVEDPDMEMKEGRVGVGLDGGRVEELRSWWKARVEMEREKEREEKGEEKEEKEEKEGSTGLNGEEKSGKEEKKTSPRV